MPFAAQLGKVLVALAIVALFLLGSLGFMHFGVSGPMGGKTGTCPFMPGVKICTMTPLQHIAAAQSMFNTLPQDKDGLFALLLLAAAVATAFFIKNIFPPPLTLVPVSIYRSNHPRGPLQEAFSKGILNPKIF